MSETKIPSARLDTTEFTFTELAVGNGTVSLPAYSFTSDQDTGIYRFAENELSITLGGVERMRVSPAQTRIISTQLGTNSGTAGAPAYTFTNDEDTGIYRPGANQVALTAGGVAKFAVDSTGGLVADAGYIRNADGSVSVPAYSFSNDPDTGIFRGGVNFLSFTAGGTEVVSFAGTGSGSAVLPGVNDTYALGSAALGWTKLYMMEGTAATPAYTFRNDTDTGLYRVGADRVSIALGGVQRFDLNATSLTWKHNGSHAYVFIDRANNTSEGLVIFSTNGTNSAAIGLDNDGTEKLCLYTNNDLGTPKITIDTGGTTTFIESIREKDGSAGSPSYTFSSDTDTGIYRSGSNQVALSSAGVQTFMTDGTFVYSRFPHLHVDGSAAAPAITFSSDTDTGIWRGASNTLNMSVGGFQRVDLTSGYLLVTPTDGVASSTLGLYGVNTGFDNQVVARNNSATTGGAGFLATAVNTTGDAYYFATN